MAQRSEPDQRVMRCPLTERQLKILKMKARGLTPHQIADGVGIDPSRIRHHLRAARAALSVDTNDQALRALVDRGWLPPGYLERAPTAAERYITAFEAYILAPPHERDQQGIRDLCNDALNELLDS